MGDVYDDLDNFTEESTIAELREENSDLKIRLEEYATKLDKLQREFDMLSSEHKKLEMNYSSLLKTAKSEIERKTQIITKLNIEKDAMVLNSIQNRNAFNNWRKPPIHNPIKNHEEAKFGNSNHTPFSGDNNATPSFSKQNPKERCEDNSHSSSNTTTPRSIQSRLLDIVNNSVNPNLKRARNNEAKENIRCKDDSGMARARISGRRKSMPVFSMEKFSSDEDELICTESSKELIAKEQPESGCLDRWGPSIGKSNIEDKISVHQKYSTENKSRHSQYDNEKYRRRARHETIQKHRTNYSSDRSRKRSHDRRKGSTERRRGSPDRNIRDTHDHSEEFYRRQEYDRCRRLVSPSKDTYYDYKQRKNHGWMERNYLHNSDRYKSRDQDMYGMKHKILPDYEHSSKRMRMDSLPNHEEERVRVERQVGHVPLDLDHIHGMSCQSPDQTHLEVLQSHQTREIKLNASTKLDDPRLISKKYVLKTYDGKTELSTVESFNIDVKVIDSSNWKMNKTIKIPDALLKKPITLDMPGVLLQKPLTSTFPDASDQKHNSSDCLSAAEAQKPTSTMSNTFIRNATSETSLQKPQSLQSTDIPDTLMQKPCFHDGRKSDGLTQKSVSTHMPDILIQKASDEVMPVASAQMTTDDLVKEIYMDIEKPISTISMDLGEIYEFQNDFDGPEEDRNEINIPEKTRYVTEPQNNDKSSQKPCKEYKIPKKILEDTHDSKIRKDILTFDEHNDSQKPNRKLISNRESVGDNNKPIDDAVDKKHSETLRQKESKIPKRSDNHYEFRDYFTAKDIIEGDLELSDENSDNTDVQIIKQTPILDNNKDSDMKDVCLASNRKEELQTINQLKFDFEKTSIQKVEAQNLKAKNIETTVTEYTKKPKTRKKSLRLKETKEPHANKDIAVSTVNKPVHKKEITTKEPYENRDTSLSMDQLITIMEDKDPPVPVKTVKKKDNKAKLPSKNKDAALSIEKLTKKKDPHSKELPENKDTVPIHNPVKKPKQVPNQKEIAAIEKPVKIKENKTKDCTIEPKNTLPLEKSAKKKQSKKTESSENTGSAATAVEKLDKKKEYKTKETKFNELFGDSSSLVSPEDLGLVQTVVVPTENYVALFEDAQDATDVSAAILPSTENTNDALRKSAKTSNFSINVKSTETPAIMIEPTNKKPTKHKLAESTINQTIYQNLQPQISPKDKDIVKTVVISTGIQPQRILDETTKYSFDNEKNDADLHVMQCVKPTVLNAVALQALATSTPQKDCQQNVVQAEIDPKFKCSNDSQEASINKNPEIVTNTSQKNDGDEPDITIFVKRRRKVVKKKL